VDGTVFLSADVIIEMTRINTALCHNLLLRHDFTDTESKAFKACLLNKKSLCSDSLSFMTHFRSLDLLPIHGPILHKPELITEFSKFSICYQMSRINILLYYN